MENIQHRTRMLAALAMMLALISVLGAVEHMIPPIPPLPPNMRLGLSNIVTMYALFFMGRKYALALAVLKSGFVFLMRGATAAFLSLCGGLVSIGVIILLSFLFRDKLSYLILSISGAIAHNLGQILGASLLFQSNLLVLAYLPILLVSGVVLGSVTGTLLRVVMPVMSRVVFGKDAHGGGT